jgi:hypothetical protein
MYVEPLASHATERRGVSCASRQRGLPRRHERDLHAKHDLHQSGRDRVPLRGLLAHRPDLLSWAASVVLPQGSNGRRLSANDGTKLWIRLRHRGRGV